MQIIYFKSQVFHSPFMALKSTGFKLFAKIMGGNYVSSCSSRISFNCTSYLNFLCINKAKLMSIVEKWELGLFAKYKAMLAWEEIAFFYWLIENRSLTEFW